MRDGAGLSSSRRRAAPVASPVWLWAPAVVRRNGESADVIRLERVGLNRSYVTVWASALAPLKAISTRHDKAAPRDSAHRPRTLAGPAITIKNTPTTSVT